MKSDEERDYISFSSLGDWKKCPFYFKLKKIDKVVEREKTIFTEFGKSIHFTLENAFTGEIKTDSLSLASFFEKDFNERMSEVSDIPMTLDPEAFLIQGQEILSEFFQEFNNYSKFSGFSLVSAEEELYEPFSYKEDGYYKFKGYIDLVIKTPDGKYHIIDFKTTTWGWDARKKSDPLVTYQLTYYKDFFAKKHNIDPADIETYFVLLKRVAKPDKKIEILRVTSGKRKTDNALKLLNECTFNIVNERFIKNKLSCVKCEFKGTIHCP